MLKDKLYRVFFMASELKVENSLDYNQRLKGLEKGFAQI